MLTVTTGTAIERIFLSRFAIPVPRGAISQNWNDSSKSSSQRKKIKMPRDWRINISPETGFLAYNRAVEAPVDRHEWGN